MYTANGNKQLIKMSSKSLGKQNIDNCCFY
jgi:hypothetical protein